jgi:hypothetical protein
VSETSIDKECQDIATTINKVDSLFNYSQYLGYKPKNGFIPNESIAIKIAEIILVQIYGKNIYEERPYNIMLKDSIWKIEGSLNPKYDKGGVFYIELNKNTGEVVKVMHTK